MLLLEYIQYFKTMLGARFSLLIMVCLHYLNFIKVSTLKNINVIINSAREREGERETLSYILFLY
jgi:hypothetical protein